MHIPIHQSLIKKQLFLGANKKAVYALSIICALPLCGLGGLLRIYTLSGFISCLFCILTWCLGMILLRLIANYDEDFFIVALRYLKYQKYYPAITFNNFMAKKSTKRNWH
jgi:type IV secretory pathway TrbD component